MTTKGMVQIFTGEGRGKTSAGMGTVMRAVGYGLKVLVIFFMKGSRKKGEYESLSHLGVEYRIFGRVGLLGPKNIKAEDRLRARQLLQFAHQALCSEEYDLVVLDEANTATAWALIPTDELLDLIRHKPAKTELIITGRYADEKIIAAADLVSDIHNIKHPFNRGLPAREGLDY